MSQNILSPPYGEEMDVEYTPSVQRVKKVKPKSEKPKSRKWKKEVMKVGNYFAPKWVPVGNIGCIYCR
jgi:hypothetical protein